MNLSYAAAFTTGVEIRMYAEPHLNQINSGNTGSYSLLLSASTATGGTCLGDSGGPNYLGSSNVVAGVTSFALSGSCGGNGGVFRMDRPERAKHRLPNEILELGQPRFDNSPVRGGHRIRPPDDSAREPFRACSPALASA